MEPEYVVATWRKMEPGTREGLLVFTALVLVILLSVIWAVYFRKPRRRHHRHYHAEPSTREATAREPDDKHATKPNDYSQQRLEPRAGFCAVTQAQTRRHVCPLRLLPRSR